MKIAQEDMHKTVPVIELIIFIIWQGRILQFDRSIWGPDFSVMPSTAVAGHYEIFNALQNKTEQNSESTRLSFKSL